jgi:hypothetical protein
MIKKYIELIKTQIVKLDEKSFELKSWKAATILIIDRIYGENSKIAEEVQNINFDMSSWTMRDTLAKQSNLESCKQKGKAILEAAISELQIVGLPIKEDETTLEMEILTNALTDELKGSQFKEIVDIVKSREKYSDKRTKILDKFKTYGADVSENILASILANEKMKKKF